MGDNSNIEKKTSVSGNKAISTPIDNFDDKLKYYMGLIQNKYLVDENFYILRHEFFKLHRAFINKENVMVSESQIFIYKGKKYQCDEFSLSQTFEQFENSNRLIVFNDVFRNGRDGELMILAKPLLSV